MARKKPLAKLRQDSESSIENTGGDEKESYEVGYRKPPKEHQFRKGVSGNRKGRPKGFKNVRTIIAEMLDQKVDLKINGQHQRMPYRAALLQRLFSDALNGKFNAIQTVMQFIKDISEGDASPARQEGIAEDDREILQRYVERTLKGLQSPET